MRQRQRKHFTATRSRQKIDDHVHPFHRLHHYFMMYVPDAAESLSLQPTCRVNPAMTLTYLYIHHPTLGLQAIGVFPHILQGSLMRVRIMSVL